MLASITSKCTAKSTDARHDTAWTHRPCSEGRDRLWRPRRRLRCPSLRLQLRPHGCGRRRALFHEEQSLGRWDCWRLAQSAETGCEDCGDGFGARRFSCGFSHVGVGVGARFFMRTSRSGDGSAGGRAAVGGVGGVQSPAAVATCARQIGN